MALDSFSRRTFLARSLRCAAGAGTIYASLGSLRLMQALASPADDYRALVCVFLFGGNDSFNMLVPYDEPDYARYAEARRNLTIARDRLLPLGSPPGAGRFALHPGMEGLQQLYANGQLAFVANTGALIEPVSKSAWENESVALPPRLFSHNDQQAFVQSAGHAGARASGWAGRMADLLAASPAALAMNVSLAGNNLWQVGDLSLPYAMSPGGVNTVGFIDPESANAQIRARTEVFYGLLRSPTGHLFGDQFAAIQQRSIDTAALVSEALDAQPPLETGFPSSNLGASLSMTARMIQAHAELGQSRQIFFIALGGWDTHGEQLAQHAALLGELSEGLAAFAAATAELGLAEQVVTFTASDFGRTLTSNGDGSDHGWGGNQIVMGGSVLGGHIYGAYPELVIGGDDDSGRGRMIPTTSTDTLGATLARWYGNFSEAELREIFPNLANFPTSDLGFLG